MTGAADLTRAADWPDLVSAALVGTDRRPVQPGGGASDPALALLSRAAVAGLAERVGAPPRRFDGVLPGPAPVDHRPLITDAAAERLRTVLDSYPKYLPEWLAAARASGYRLPAVLFPRLLDLGRTNTLIRPDLAILLGAPGRWLAVNAGVWRYILREARAQLAPQDWQGTDPDARIAYVAGLYLQDPDAARALIRRAWPGERVPVKLGLLALTSRHAVPEDLAFVESLIEDPSKQVRDEATLLAGALQRRRDKRANAQFTSEIARLLTGSRGLGRELHNFVMSRADEPWPEDGARLLLDALAAYSARGDQPAWSGWIAEQLQTAVADHAPVSVRAYVARLLGEQALNAVDGAAPPQVDFTTVLTLLTFRRDLLAELAPATEKTTP